MWRYLYPKEIALLSALGGECFYDTKGDGYTGHGKRMGCIEVAFNYMAWLGNGHGVAYMLTCSCI